MKNRWTKVIKKLTKVLACLSLMMCCLAGTTRTAYASDDDFRPEFTTKNNKTYEEGESVKIKWDGSTDKYLIAVRNITTNEKIVNNKKITKESYTLKGLEPGEYKIAIAGCVGSKNYWCSSYLYFEIKEELERPVFKTQTGLHYKVGDKISFKWSDCDAEEYIFAIRNIDTGYKPKEAYISKNRCTLNTSNLPKGNYVVNVAAVSESGSEYWSQQSISFELIKEKASNQVFDYTYLTCNSYVSNYDKRNYINWAMQQYIEKQTALQENLCDGKKILFFFEGGTDASVGYDPEEDTERNNAIVLVVKLVNGYPEVIFASDKCSTLPDFPMGYGSYREYYGPATTVDGIYETRTVNHTGYGALNLVMPNNQSALYLEPDGSYSLMGAGGINIHARWTAEPVKVVNHKNVNSVGCVNIGESYKDGVYSAFMKKVTGHKIEVKPSKIALEYTGEEIGCTIIDRQLFKNELYVLYGGNWNAVEALTAGSYSLLHD